MIFVPSDTVLRVLLDLQNPLVRVGYFNFIAVIEAADVVVDTNFGQVSECLIIIVAETAAVLDDQSIIHLA